MIYRKKEYDVAVIGAGPNGLICATYLARAGLSVILLEARHETGGGLDTLEFAGHKYNVHAIYHMMAKEMPAYKDFDLAARGVKYIFPDVQVAYINKNEKPMIFYHDPEKTKQFIEKEYSAADAKNYARMYSDFKEFSEKILMPFTYVPAIPALEQVMALESASDDAGKRFSEISEMTPVEILDHYGISDPLKAKIYNLFSMWGLSNYDGIGFLFPLYVYRMTNAALVSGGSHRLSSAIHKAATQYGVEIHDRAEVERVILTNGKVTGLVIEGGDEIRAKAVVSTVDPKQNFTRFFNENEISADLVEGAKRWEWEKSSLFGVHTALRSAPEYIGSDKYKDLNKAMITFMGVDDTNSILDHMDRIESGHLADPPEGHTTTTSIFDPITAPKGFHTGRFECNAPYDADWEKIKYEYAEKCIKKWKEYAPNLDVFHTQVYPPTYIAMKFKDMVRGSIKQGAYNTLQLGYLRPNERCSQVSTPIEGFFVCGASAYPGGMILGGSGYIGANVIADIFGVKKDWEELESVKYARETGLLPADI